MVLGEGGGKDVDASSASHTAEHKSHERASL